MKTVYGILSDELGHAASETRAWSSPALQYRSAQDAVRVDRDHDGRAIGSLIHLELDRRSRLWAVAHVDDSVTPSVDVRVGVELRSVPAPLYWSASRLADADRGDLVLGSIALTNTPARICPGPPLRFLPGSLDYRREPPSDWKLTPAERELLTRAARSLRDRRRSGADAPVVIRDLSLERQVDRLNALSGEDRASAILQLAADEDRFGMQPGGPLRFTQPVHRPVISVR